MLIKNQGVFPLTQFPSSVTRTERLWRHSLGDCFAQTLDRVNVLGDDDGNYGHSSCVNALSWARDGSVLLSGGDDRTVRIWRQDPSDTDHAYPFVCTSVLRTGHKANIFNAQMLPYSSRIVSVAGDRQVRVLDAEVALSDSTTGDLERLHRVSDTCIKNLRCHHGRVKRIVTEDSPDLFLTVAEDGAVRQHDLRVNHTCGHGSCPAPIIKCDHELSTLALSPLTPYQFVVAGESAYVFAAVIVYHTQ
ncbi:hypothetical protein HGRIS_009572 [Hohenbuehelia grisea]|uniref:Uncharacterized protein n=1 Tax=Hohenbuehelia grisea TaxID=104357 RepID=A0ABR3J1V5_9AGAR